MVDAVVLDYGHTIVDYALDERALLAAYEEVRSLLVGYAADQAPPSAEELVRGLSGQLGAAVERSYLNQELAELDMAGIFAAGLAELGLAVPMALAARIVELEHRALTAEIHLAPENARALAALHGAGLSLGLVSNITTPGELLREDLHRLGILDLFSATIFSSELGLRKPHPRAYAAALEGLGVGGGRAVFVGDRLREDVAGPQAAGMRAVLTHQFRAERPGVGTPQPDAVIGHLRELPSLIGRWRGEG